MSKTFFWQAVRLAVMVLAVAGIIYALEFMHGGIAVWFWVALLGIGFFGLLVSFRAARRRSVRQQSFGARRRRKSCRR
ncbi:hypothetical protein [uncultured Alistipes sp.]|uniref:hypothetical protein n=1 Tax=uncultured Alistipes sp. TaxID=538949 RepID=UPI00272D7387|nr:hypothetical protein [uncultured Alistipes sp.]